MSRIDLATLFPQLNSLVRTSLSKKVSLEYELHKEPIDVDVDENQMLQMIMNLVTNAAEALGNEEGRIVRAAEVGPYDKKELESLDPAADLPAGDYARLTVTDDGSGMDAETAFRIFDPFFTTKFTGRGLGLAAVQGIISRRRGVIQLETEPGNGTTFSILLPTIAEPHPANPESESAAPEGDSRKRVLVVDDDHALRRALVKRFQPSGFDVIDASDDKEAVDIFSENSGSIDCVLLDVSMPKLGGEEVCKRLGAIRETVPIVVMSGFNEAEVLE